VCSHNFSSDRKKDLVSVLVSGGAGYIGSVVTECLIRRGRSPVVLDNLSQGHRAAVPPGVPLVEADLLDKPFVEKVFRDFTIDAVIHLAAVSVVGDSVQQPTHYYRQNVGGLLNLLEVMLPAGVNQIVFSSTAAVYGKPDTIPITEECAARPINPYGWTKLVGEQILADAHAAYGLDYVSLRYFNVAGATEACGEAHHPETHLIPRLLAVAARQVAEFEIYGTDYETPDGTCIRDYIHVGDLAEAHTLALGRLRDAGEVYNLGGNRGYSVREVISCAEKVTGQKIPCVIRPRRPGDPPTLVASHEKIRDQLGWRPERGLEEMIHDAWRWLARQPNGFRE
jgi:UDP-glucose 4-epimerase